MKLKLNFVWSKTLFIIQNTGTRYYWSHCNPDYFMKYIEYNACLMTPKDKQYIE